MIGNPVFDNDHGGLNGLGDDDHIQYFLADGTRTLNGPLTQQAGDTVFNATSVDVDFTIKKNTSGDAFIYDAGTDKLTLSGGFVSDTFKYLDADTGGLTCLFIGNDVAPSNSGNENLYVGSLAGRNNTSGYQNVGVGAASLYTCTTGYQNLAIGGQALVALNSGALNTALGYSALSAVTTAVSNVGIGAGAGKKLTTGGKNLAIGTNALISVTTQIGNVALGSLALERSTTASYSIVIGDEAGRLDTTMGANNIFIGRNTGWNTSWSVNNVFIGAFAGKSNAGTDSVFIGTAAGENETGSNLLYIANSNTVTPLIKGDFSASELRVHGEFQSTALRETKVTSSVTETVSVKTATYLNIDTAGNTLTLSNMVDGSKLQIRNGSSGDATLNFDITLGATTFTSPVTMPAGDSYEVVYDSGSSAWVM